MTSVKKALLLPFLLFPLLPARAPGAGGLPAPGFSCRTLLALKGGAFPGGMDLLPGGDLVFFQGNLLFRWDGKKRVLLHAFPAGTAGAFVKYTAKGVFAAESTNGRIYRLDPLSGKTTLIAAVRYPFDLVQAPRGGLYLSANPGWGGGGSGNRIYLLDPARGGLDEIVRLQGPSGPVAFDARGNLYYATQSSTYPTPPGAVRILRWPAARVRAAAGPGYLTAKDAVTVWSNLDGAFGMVLDGMGRIYLTDPRKGILLQLDPEKKKKRILLQAPPFSWTGYTFLRLAGEKGPATLDPWQPPGGGRLVLAASDYLSYSAFLELSPSRPVLASTPWPAVPPGSLSLDLSKGPASSAGILLLSPLGASPEIGLPLGERAPLFLGVLPHPWMLAFPVTTGAKGSFSLKLTYPGGGPMVVYGQVLFLGSPGLPATSSPLGMKLL